MSSAFEGPQAAHSTYVDWADLAGLDQIVKAYSVGDSVIIVQLADARELRITARLDLATGRYVADFERRTVLKTEGRSMLVWAHTPAYKQVVADGLQSCLEAAVLEVDRVRVY
jgi:hypothetical protein